MNHDQLHDLEHKVAQCEQALQEAQLRHAWMNQKEVECINLIVQGQHFMKDLHEEERDFWRNMKSKMYDDLDTAFRAVNAAKKELAKAYKDNDVNIWEC